MIWLPLGLALSSWAAFALGAAPFRSQSKETTGGFLDHLYPVTVAFFLGYLGMTLLPHALFEARLPPLLAFAAGAGGMAFLTRRVFHSDPCCEIGHEPNPHGWASFVALSICAVNDGILIGILSPSWFSGLNLGMVFHKVTSSFALAVVLGHWHYRGRRLYSLGLIHGLISPVCFFVGRLLLGFHPASLDVLLGFSGGILTYTVLTGMLPHSGEMLKRKPTAWIGFLAALALSLYLGYLHRAMHMR